MDTFWYTEYLILYYRVPYRGIYIKWDLPSIRSVSVCIDIIEDEKIHWK